MSVNDYFDYEFDGDTESQADEIVHEAKDKLVDLIYENVKSEIERYKNWYESAAEVRDKLQKRVYEQAEQIKVLEIDLKRTKEELERKDNEIPKVPFMPGDKVWWIGNDSMNEVTIKCPICEGKGKVKTQTTDYGEVEIICPCCKGNSTTRYEPAKAYQGYVVRTRITLDAADDVPDFIYDKKNLDVKDYPYVIRTREETAENILTKLYPYIGGWVLFKELKKEYNVKVEIKE